MLFQIPYKMSPMEGSTTDWIGDRLSEDQKQIVSVLSYLLPKMKTKKANILAYLIWMATIS